MTEHIPNPTSKRYGGYDRLGYVRCLGCLTDEDKAREEWIDGRALDPDRGERDQLQRPYGYDWGDTDVLCHECGTDIAAPADADRAAFETQQAAYAREARFVVGEYNPDGTLARFSIPIRCY